MVYNKSKYKYLRIYIENDDHKKFNHPNKFILI